MKFTIEKVRSFFYTDAFLAIAALMIFLSWLLKIEWLGMGSVVLFAVIVFVFSKDATPALALLFFAPFMISKSSIEGQLYLMYFFIPLGLAMVYHFVKNRSKIKIGKMFMPQLAVSIAMLVGGCLCISVADYTRALGHALLLGFVILALYFIFNQYINTEEVEKHTDMRKYFAKILMYVGLILTFQMLTFYIRANVPTTSLVSSAFNLGWGISNNTATILLLTAPMCFYLMTVMKHGWIYAIIGLVQYVTIVLTYSRGGVLAAAISGVITVVLTVVYSKNRKTTLVSYGCIIAVVAIVYFVMFDQINNVLKTMIGQGVGVSGRDDLYAEAMRFFMSQRFFGVGMGISGIYYDINEIGFYWVHSTFFQVIASMGVFGLLCYIYYYYKRFRIVCTGIKKRSYNFFMLIAFLGFEIYSMIDTGTFVPIPCMMMVILMTLIVEKTNKQTVLPMKENYLRQQNSI